MLKYKIIDLFAGAGGLSNGFEQTEKFEVIGAVEISKEAIETYVTNHNNNRNIIITPEDNHISDISNIDFKNFSKQKGFNGSEAVVIGGPPCQGFSNANRQKNYLISGNNQLVKQYARAIDEIRPIAFLMENVKTMNSDTHKFFVTKHIENTIYAYSSEQHLQNIVDKLGMNPFWEDDTLILIETDQNDLHDLIQAIANESFVNPILNEQEQLSKIRSIIRKLKAKKVFQLKNEKEVSDANSLIFSLKNYSVDNYSFNINLQKIIDNAIETLELLINEEVKENKTILKQLEPFILVNQLLRYLNEISEEKIVVTGKPKVEISNKGNLQVVLQVKSYNIVKYLESFFKYLDYDIDAGVVRSVNFFVPQKRERFMILGVNRTYAKEEVTLPKKIESELLPFKVEDAIKDLENIQPQKSIEDNEVDYMPTCDTRMKKYFRAKMSEEILYNHINTDSEVLSMERFKEIKRNNGKNFHSLSDELKEITYTDSSRTQNTVYLRLNYDQPSPTVINVRKSMWQHPTNAVALSIREAARLQSFRDDFIFKGTKDKQYQQIGNAVPPLMARAVAEQMLYILGEEPNTKLEVEFNS
ncbi:MAG: DNA cytosine methyltransferase [Solibacillus sp.]